MVTRDVARAAAPRLAAPRLAAPRPAGPVGGDGESPVPQSRPVAALPADHLSMVVGRALGTVVVTVQGEVGLAGGELLEGLLIDLIEGQGNLAVAVDLGRAVVGPEAHPVFIDAARRARRHGARFIVKEPPPATFEALRAIGSDNGMEIQPRRTARR